MKIDGRRQRKAQTGSRRQFSIAFLIAIPGNFVLATIGLFSLITLLAQISPQPERWAIFVTGLIGGLVIVGGSEITKLRVVVHEFKHALVVMLSGNSVKDFHVGTNTGHVKFEMHANKAHFAPIIALAPYFFPLFSLPVLVACLALEGHGDPFLVLALGGCLAADTSMAYTDLHPNQSDLKQVTGGYFTALLYLAGTHFLWWILCLLWIADGRKAFVYAGYTLAKIGAVLSMRAFH